MQLKIYLLINRMSITEFSEILNYSRNQVSGVINGKIKPGRKLAKLIEKATEGAVKAKDLLSLEYEGYGK